MSQRPIRAAGAVANGPEQIQSQQGDPRESTGTDVFQLILLTIEIPAPIYSPSTEHLACLISVIAHCFYSIDMCIANAQVNVIMSFIISTLQAITLFQ